MSHPLVSIVIICYNYGRYIEEAVKSAVGQTYDNIEVIILDDGSTDNTKAISKALEKEHSNLRYIYQKNAGVVVARNRAIDEVRGDYYIQLDADDFLDEDYVEKTLATAEQSEADIVYTDFKGFGLVDAVSNFPDFNFDHLKNENFIHISALVRKQSIGQIRFDTKLSRKTHEDWDFFMHVCANGAKAVKCKTTLLHYRIHGKGRNNMKQDSTQWIRYVDTYAYIIRRRLEEGYHDDFSYLSILWFEELSHRLMQETHTAKKQCQDALAQKDILDQQVDQLKKQINDMTHSKSYRLGRLLLFPARKLKRILRGSYTR